MTSVLHSRDPLACRTPFTMSTPTTYPSPPMASAINKPATPYEDASMADSQKAPQQTQHSGHATAKRRPSRAGTRSVTTLTAAQLERKRANDREAQRAIRQRTKDHIEGLERQIRDLTAAQEGSSAAKVMELMRRNEDLEQENAMLRTRLSHAVAAMGCPDNGMVASSTLAGALRSAPAVLLSLSAGPRHAGRPVRAIGPVQRRTRC